MVMILWFILLSSNAGYLEPIYVDRSACSAPSPTAGTLTYDREVNPTIVRWSNCLVDVSARIAQLPQGVYEFSTTELGVSGYLAPDPHVAGPVVIGEDFKEQGTAKPTDKFAWTTTDPIAAASAYRWELELDSVVQSAPLTAICVAGTPNTCTAPIPAITPSQHVARVRPIDVSVPATPIVGPWSDPLTFTMRAAPAKPGSLTVQPGGSE